MEVKKGYKQTEAGVIPEDWDSVWMGTLANIRRGASPRPIDSPIWFDNQSSTGWLRISDVTKAKKYLTETTQNLSDLGIANSRFIERGNLVMSICATVGRPILTSKDVCIHDGFVVFNGLKVDKEYLYYVLTDIEKNWSKHGQTGSQMNLNTGLINSTPIPLPPTKAEQSVIATVLSDADALIQSLEKFIAKKRNIKQGAMQELLKPKKGWVVKKLGNVAVLKARIGWQGLTTAEYKETGDYYLITGTDFKNGFIDWENCVYVESQRYQQDKNIQINENDVLVTKDGTIGKVAFIKNIPKPATLNSGVFVIRPIEQSFHHEFFYYLLLSEYFTEFLSQLSAGSTINHLYQKDFVHFEFQTPRTIEEQTRIATILSDMDAEIAALETKLVKYKQVKQGMMQKLLTGTIRLLNIDACAKPKATVTVMPVQIDSQKKKHNWEFNEAVVISVLGKTFGTQSYPLGRRRYTKLSYLLHRYAEKNAEGYLKKVAGPYNPSTKYGGPEKIAQARGYIKYHSTGNYTGYIADDNIEEAVTYFNKWYGQEVLRWLEQFRYKDKDQLELLTTVDMAVHDLEQNNQKVSVASVKDLIKNHAEWRAKLDRPNFCDNNIKAAIRLSEDLFGS